MYCTFKEIKFASDEYQDMLDLRERILREPLGLQISKQDIEDEENQFHYGLFKSQELIACVIFKPLNTKICKLRQMAVSPAYQKQGLGKKLILACEVILQKKAYQLIELAARENAIGFYNSINYKVEGDPFLELGIAHQKMTKCFT